MITLEKLVQIFISNCRLQRLTDRHFHPEWCHTQGHGRSQTTVDDFHRVIMLQLWLRWILVRPESGLRSAPQLFSSTRSLLGKDEGSQWVCICLNLRGNISCTVRRRSRSWWMCSCACVYVCVCVWISCLWRRRRPEEQNTSNDQARQWDSCLGDTGRSWKQCDPSQTPKLPENHFLHFAPKLRQQIPCTRSGTTHELWQNSFSSSESLFSVEPQGDNAWTLSIGIWI